MGTSGTPALNKEQHPDASMMTVDVNWSGVARTTRGHANDKMSRHGTSRRLDDASGRDPAAARARGLATRGSRRG